MIRIYLLDFSGADAGIFRSALQSYIGDTRNAALKRERSFAYALLEYALRDCLSGELSAIKRDEFKRPFIDGGIDFNISHDGDFAAVIISDSMRVGIDISLTDKKPSERLEKKLLSYYENNGIDSMYFDCDGVEIRPFYYDKNEKCIKKCDNGIIFLKQDEKSFHSAWTALEAISKADGRGLAHLLSGKPEGDYRIIKSATIKDLTGKAYSLSAAVKLKIR